MTVPVPINSLRTSNSPRMDLDEHAWAWDDEISEQGDNRSGLIFDEKNHFVLFHPTYSSGTLVVRGDTPFVSGHDYYWEIEILSPLYGTDVMIGVGTTKVSFTDKRHFFCSLLGSDKESWGYSYNGTLQHNGQWRSYGPGFNNGSTIGMHLNTWDGTLSYFVDGKPLGVAFHLKGQVLYPMVCSTAACSALRLIFSFSCTSSLQLLSLRALNTSRDMMKVVSSIPGLQRLVMRTNLKYRNSVKNKNSENPQIKLNASKNQCGPNFIIVDNDEEEEVDCLPQRRRKRKYIVDIRSRCSTRSLEARARCSRLDDDDSDSRCVQCGATLRPRVRLMGSNRVTTVPSPRSPVVPIRNNLCLICDVVL